MRFPRMAGPPGSGTSSPAQDLAKAVTEESKATEAHSQGLCRPRWPVVDIYEVNPKGSPLPQSTTEFMSSTLKLPKCLKHIESTTSRDFRVPQRTREKLQSSTQVTTRPPGPRSQKGPCK